MSDVPDLGAIEARAAAATRGPRAFDDWFEHVGEDCTALVAYARRMKGQCDVLAELLAVLGRENAELRAEVARLERVIAARRFYDGG